MNNLSWLLYIADVVGNVGNVLSVFSVILGAVLAFWAILLLPIRCHGDSDDVNTHTRVGKILIPSFIAMTLVGAFIPSKDTVYAIAASEMGERVMNTPTFSKATAALNAWLDRQIKPESNKDDKNAD